ncbi:MAG: MotA/TolQ/ExbB proton channel family protein [candidate division Zixibacteria bacterium]|nr:MotA/TolQ/ExbB proton channel family protein [candidate division Zixibacteria bacterium]
MSSMFAVSIFSGTVWEIIGGTSTFGVFILIVLAFMSFVSWVIIFHKWRQFGNVDKENSAFVRHFRRSRTIAETAGQAKASPSSPLARIYLAGLDELNQLHERKNEGGGLQERQKPLDTEDFEIVEMTMEKAVTEQVGFLEKKVIFLATTGNSAPFMGLLGTVVGIMDSFWAIGERGSASLAVVAPGIAEALLATIVGLGAAIPAVIAYNWANNKLKFISDSANGFILEFVARAKKENK